MSAFFQSGHHEPIKAIAHGGAALLFASFAGYNTLAIVQRDDPEPHLAVNVLLDLVVTIIECRKALHHVRAHRAEQLDRRDAA